MNDDKAPRASVVLTSRNRKEDLIVAIRSALGQSVPVEVLVFDDASTDGTADAVRQQFPPEQYPHVRLFQEKSPVGYIVLRNKGARLARTSVIVSIDDDAIFTTPRVVEQTLAEFDHPRIGAVAIPFQNIRISEEVLQRAADPAEVQITAEYIGTAHALRRDLFLELGAYRENLIHQGEEPDYCIRLLNAGYVVRLGSADPIHHFVSPKRDMRRLHYYGARNNVRFIWDNVPFFRRPFYLARTSAAILLHAVKVRAVGIKLRALWNGFWGGMFSRRTMPPVSASTLRLFRRLRAAPRKFSAVIEELPALKEEGALVEEKHAAAPPSGNILKREG